MKRLLKKLFRDLLTSNPARGGRPASNRTLLQLNGLEDRMVLSTAGLSGSTLQIIVSPNSTVELFEAVSGANRKVEVIGVTGNPEFAINSIKATEITFLGGSGSNAIINDSDGMPFQSNSTITFNGGGSNNKVFLDGSRSIDTAGDYLATGEASQTEASLTMDNLTFDFTAAVTSVNDSIQLAGPLNVTTNSQNMVLSAPAPETQSLSNLGIAAGILDYSNMGTVNLTETAADATVNLDTSIAASLESQFNVLADNAGDIVQIAATPSGVSTGVHVVDGGSEVVLEANSGAVSVSGVAGSTSVILGQLNSNHEFVTSGIKANVQVSNVGSLIVANSGNDSTKETVTVTQSSISGTGLFGNNAAVVKYSGVGTVDINSGQLQDSYTVEASSSTASFSSQINLFDDSSEGFSAHVFLDAKTDLHLSLQNETSKAGELFIDAPGAKFENSNGVVDAFFDGVLSSQIDFQGFAIEEEKS
jgi:hypothetical protein